MKERYYHIIGMIMSQALAIILGLIVCAIISLLCGCSRKVTQEVPVEVPHVKLNTDYINKTIDTKVIAWEKLTVTLSESGDTLRTDRERNLQRDSVRTDTFMMIRKDSVHYPVYLNKTIEVPYIPKLYYCAMGGMIALLFTLIIVIWIIRKKAHQH